jgi:hypothetical protein
MVWICRSAPSDTSSARRATPVADAVTRSMPERIAAAVRSAGDDGARPFAPFADLCERVAMTFSRSGRDERLCEIQQVFEVQDEQQALFH